MSRFIAKTYKRLLEKHFLKVQAVQTSLLMGTGDFIAQTFVECRDKSILEKKTYDYKRTLRFSALGLVLVGPTLTIWYRILSKRIGNVSSSSVVLKKVALDQLCFAPCFTMVFISSLNLINGNGIKEIKEDINNKYLSVLLMNYRIWPMVQLINFYVLPLQYQVLLVQSVALVWNTYLSCKLQ